jgi:tmRNA-binding protein
LALSKGKKNYDKRESKKKKSWEREKRNIKWYI